MNEAPSTEMNVWVVILIPLVFFIVFPLIWCLVMWINSRVSGWNRLARFYRSDVEPAGKHWDGIQGRVGLVSYKGVLECTTNESGVFLQPSALFKIRPSSAFHSLVGLARSEAEAMALALDGQRPDRRAEGGIAGAGGEGGRRSRGWENSDRVAVNGNLPTK